MGLGCRVKSLTAGSGGRAAGMTSVEDSIANLTYYMTENARLKKELEDVRFILSVEVAEAYDLIQHETKRIKEENEYMEKQIAAAFAAIDACRNENYQLEKQIETLKGQS